MLYGLHMRHTRTPSTFNTMSVFNSSQRFPTRQTAPANRGPKIVYDFASFRDQMSADPHAISRLFHDNEGWESQVWSGQELKSPFRALWGAEMEGLSRRISGNRAKDVSIREVTNHINASLHARGLKVVSENTVTSNLRFAAKYLNHALDLSLRIDTKTGTVRLIDEYEAQDHLKLMLNKKAKHDKELAASLRHSRVMGIDTEHLLQDHAANTGLTLALTPSSAE